MATQDAQSLPIDINNFSYSPAMGGNMNVNPGMGEFSSLLEPLYASLWDNQGFDGFLNSFIQMFECNAASLISVQHEPRQARYGWIVGIPEKYVRWYIENNKVEDDPSLQLFEAKAADEDGFVTTSSVLKEISLIDVATEEFKPWLQAVEMTDTAGIIIPVADDHQIFFALQRDKSVGRFSDEDVQKMNLMVPHIKQAVQLYIKLYRQQNDHSSLDAAINTLPRPTFVLNSFMEIQTMNAQGEDFLNNDGSLHLEDGCLRIKDFHVQEEFVRRALEMSRATENILEDMNSTILLSKEGSPVTMTLSPMFTKNGDQKSKGVLVQVFDPTSLALPTAEKIKSIFKLSTQQSIICELLVKGLSLKEIAQEKDVSIHTVREQVRIIFRKTDYNRQSELIAAILRAVP